MCRDDVAVIGPPASYSGPSPFPGYTDALLELLTDKDTVENNGIVLLGSCAPAWVNEQVWVHRLNGHGNGHADQSDALPWLRSRRGIGLCMHATGMTKWRTRRMYNDIGIYLPKSQHEVMDQCFRSTLLLMKAQPWLFGSELVSPQEGGHIGAVFQDRLNHHTTIWRR